MNWMLIAVGCAGCGAYVYAMSMLGKWLARSREAQTAPLSSLPPLRERRQPATAEPSVLSG